MSGPPWSTDKLTLASSVEMLNTSNPREYVVETSNLPWSTHDLGYAEAIETLNTGVPFEALAIRLQRVLSENCASKRSYEACARRLDEIYLDRTENVRTNSMEMGTQQQEQQQEAPEKDQEEAPEEESPFPTWQWKPSEIEVAMEIEQSYPNVGAKTLNYRLQQELKRRLGSDRGLGGCRRRQGAEKTPLLTSRSCLSPVSPWCIETPDDLLPDRMVEKTPLQRRQSVYRLQAPGALNPWCMGAPVERRKVAMAMANPTSRSDLAIRIRCAPYGGGTSSTAAKPS
jgi:hypothetical protein